MKRVSMEKIAKELDVSTVTVHKALTNQKGVSESLKLKVLKLSRELGYISPSVDCNNFIFLIHKNLILNSGSGFYSAVYNNISAECLKNNARLHLVVHDNLAATVQAIKAICDGGNVDGTFIAGEIDGEIFNLVLKLKKPTVCVDCFKGISEFNYVIADNFIGGYEAAKYLINKGHKNIGFAGDISLQSTADKFLGYQRALIENNIFFDIKNFINSDLSAVSESEFSAPDFTTPTFTKYDFSAISAIICSGDQTAAAVYKILKSQNITIGEEVSVISFGNDEICNLLSPALTSFYIPQNVISSRAYELMRALNCKSSLVQNCVKLTPTVYERQSVKIL